ncbi:CvpA family protein [Blattabacterium cuenoti]|uniref:CvpA family protein n=1 Tax=Blattabacterium cuenoti TaxID=1653831 RepID=UPI00163BE9DC|nr:CvpA family protein [Blattabacterium cuenoti]
MILNIIIIAIVLYGGYHGYKKGFISQFFMFMTFLIFFYKGESIYYIITELLNKLNIINKFSSYFIIYSLIISFFSIIILSFLFKKIIKIFLHITCMKPMDRFFGIILGMIKYFFYLSICFFFLKEANRKINIIPDIYLKNSFEKEFQFIFSEFLFNKIKKLYFIFKFYF